MMWSVVVADVQPRELRRVLEEVVAGEKFAEMDPKELAFGVERAVAICDSSDTGQGLVTVQMWKKAKDVVRVQFTLQRDFAVPGAEPAVEKVDEPVAAEPV